MRIERGGAVAIVDVEWGSLDWQIRVRSPIRLGGTGLDDVGIDLMAEVVAAPLGPEMSDALTHDPAPLEAIGTVHLWTDHLPAAVQALVTAAFGAASSDL